MSTVTSGAEEHAERSVLFYAAIAIFLAILTLIEVGPLFEWYDLPASVLIALSVVKFFFVVAFFMHLWDDASVFTRVFVVPLLGSVLMVIVLMLLFHTIYPSPHDDAFVVQERHYENWNQPCHSWLVSSVSNRSYCASPPVDRDRLAMFVAGEAGPADGPPPVDISGMSDNERFVALRERGQQLYEQNCATCHGSDGLGVSGVYPPLAGADYIQDPNVHIDVLLRGLSGQIVVNGQTYNGVMTSFSALNDFNIAAVITYERNSWGNDLGIVLPEEVRRRR